MLKRKTKIKGHATGIEPIDQTWSGLKDGDLYCFCCTSHVDKHNLLAKVIVGLASREIGVVIFTLDCSHRDMYKRLIEVIKNFDTSLSGKDPSQRAFEANEKFGSYAIWIQDVPVLNYESLRDRLQSLTYLNKHAVECVVIDNIEKIETNFRTPSREMKLEANLYLMKMIAKEYKIPVIVSSSCDNLYLDKIIKSGLVNQYLIVKTIEEDIADAQTSGYSTITIPHRDFAENLFESILSVAIK